MAKTVEIIQPNPIDYQMKVGGELVAQTHQSGEFAPDRLHWYIIVFDYDGEPVEEVDIDAKDKTTARKLAQHILDNDYEDGGKIGETILA